MKLGFPPPIVVADAGLLSRKNIDALVEDGYEYILGARIKNENKAVRQRILDLGLTDGQAASIKTDDVPRIVVSFPEKRRKRDTSSSKIGSPAIWVTHDENRKETHDKFRTSM